MRPLEATAIEKAAVEFKVPEWRYGDESRSGRGLDVMRKLSPQATTWMMCGNR
jgi:hypothetical protein